jgi:hypothetical protein
MPCTRFVNVFDNAITASAAAISATPDADAAGQFSKGAT